VGEEKPREVVELEKILRVEAEEWKHEVPPGFKYPVWMLKVHDAGTSEKLWVVMGVPYEKHHLYRLARIRNRLGHTITVLAPREEAWKVEVRVATVSDVEEERERAEEVVGRVVPRPPPRPEPKFPWAMFRRDVSRFLFGITRWEAAVAEKKAVALYGYISTFRGKMEFWKAKALEVSEWVMERERVVEAPRILTAEEEERLWGEFSRMLREGAVEPEKYRDRFREVLDPTMPYGDNLMVVRDEAKAIVAAEGMERAHLVARKPFKAFSWKKVGWGVSYTKMRLSSLLDSAEKEDVATTYLHLQEVVGSAGLLMAMLEKLPEVRGFKEFTGI